MDRGLQVAGITEKPIGWLAAAMSLGLLLGAPAMAQQQVNDGRALDNNLQAGSGGVNQAQQQPDYRARNDLVTGNVAGSGYFRGDVGYGAPEAFRGSSAEDSLFRFRALSYPTTSPQQLGGRPSVTLLPSTAGVTAGRTSTWITSDGLIAGSADRGGIGTHLSSWTTRSLIDPGGLLSPGSRLGTRPLPDGRLLQLLPPAASVEVPDATSGGPANVAGVPASTQIDPTRSAVTHGTGTDRLFAELRVTLPLGIDVAQAYQNQVQSTRVDEQMPTEDQRMTRLAASMFSPLGSTEAKAGDDVYLDLLRGVQRNYQLASGVPAEEVARRFGEVETPAPSQPREAVAPAWLPSVTAEQLEVAARKRQVAAAQARGLPAPPAQDAGADVANEGDPLVDAIAQQIAPLETLAGMRESQVNAMLTEAETQLANGRYFNAIDGFEKVLTLQPGHPMAWAGLVHSQLGAGMIRSASHSLRRLFEQYPELVATRYEARLLPSRERIVWVRTQLDRMIDTTDVADPALMLAYIGHQFDSRELIEYGLDLAQARQPDDAMIALMRRIWLAIPPRIPTSP